MIDERDIKFQVFNYLNMDTKHNNTIDTVSNHSFLWVWWPGSKHGVKGQRAH